MPTIHRFEDLEVWQNARKLTKQLYIITAGNSFRSDLWFRSQIRRSGISIMANVAEGFFRHSDKEFRQFLFIARGSCAELQSHFYVALDQQLISQQEFAAVSGQLEYVSKMLSSFIRHLSRQDSTDHSTQ